LYWQVEGKVVFGGGGGGGQNEFIQGKI
jgi:hypothetical protein